MVLPLFLAMNASELTAFPPPENCAWMACHFSSCGEGISNIPRTLPPGSMLILNDRVPCQGHSADLVAAQIREAASHLQCESILLDFQRPDNPETESVVQAILDTAPCTVCVSERYGRNLPCPILLGPPPLHMPMKDYLAPWKNHEIWLEAALCQSHITVTEKGTEFSPCYPGDNLDGVFFEEALCCHYHTQFAEGHILFTLFDTPESLAKKLELAHSLGISRAVGLWQELGTFLPGK
jgi:hypothetical protein